MKEVFGNDLVDVFSVDEAVPDGFGIDHDDGAVLALIEATGLVGADVVLEAGLLDRVFECGFELFAASWETAGAGAVSSRSFAADENVVIEFRHCISSLLIDGR